MGQQGLPAPAADRFCRPVFCCEGSHIECNQRYAQEVFSAWQHQPCELGPVTTVVTVQGVQSLSQVIRTSKGLYVDFM